MNQLRSELDQVKKDISKKSDQVSSLKDSKKKLSNSVENIKTDFSERLTKLEEEFLAQQTGMVLAKIYSAKVVIVEVPMET